MPRVKIHRNQLTLPDDLRRALGAADDDELVEDGVLLKPSSGRCRELARERIRAIQERVHLSPELEALSPEELEEALVEEVKAYRRERGGYGYSPFLTSEGREGPQGRSRRSHGDRGDNRDWITEEKCDFDGWYRTADYAQLRRVSDPA